jgi:hypothetical protein
LGHGGSKSTAAHGQRAHPLLVPVGHAARPPPGCHSKSRASGAQSAGRGALKLGLSSANGRRPRLLPSFPRRPQQLAGPSPIRT